MTRHGGWGGKENMREDGWMPFHECTQSDRRQEGMQRGERGNNKGRQVVMRRDRCHFINVDEE